MTVLGEADAATEWLADSKRNRKGQRSSPAFFRRWLKRETDTAHPGSAASVTHEASAQPAQARLAANGAGPPGVPPAENPYQAFVRKQAQAALRRVSGRQEDANHETSS